MTSPQFARAAYALFGAAILAALLELDGVSGTKPLVLRSVPATPVVKAEKTALGEEGLEGGMLDLPDAERLFANMHPSEPATTETAVGGTFVFYRPDSRSAREDAGSTVGEPVCGNLGDSPESSRAIFPLPKAYFNSYDDTWGAPRPQGGHEGTDLMSPAGAPEFAITDGIIVPVSGANGDGWNHLGGYTVMLKAAHDVGPIKEGDLFYYAHMNEESALPVGTKVRAGQQIGMVGDTGEGPEGTRGRFPPHLHLGWYTNADSDRTNLESGAINPYPLLLWLESYGGAVAGATDAAYCEALRTPTPEPSMDEDSWPTPDPPGTRPDLDTGDQNDARPSPAIAESRHGHDPSSGRQRKPDRQNRSSKPDERTRATSEGSKAEPDGGFEKDSRTKRHGGTFAAVSGNRSSRSPVEDSSQKAEIQRERPALLSGSSHLRPAWTSPPSYASVPGDTLPKETTEDRNDENADRVRDARDGDPQVKEQQRERKELSNTSGHKAHGAPGKRGGPSIGHDVHITRAGGPHRGRRAFIKYEEWLKVVKDDPELLMHGPAEVTRRAKGSATRTKAWRPGRDIPPKTKFGSTCVVGT